MNAFIPFSSGTRVSTLTGKLADTFFQGDMFQKATDVSPVDIELMKSVSVFATRPMLPDFASFFRSSQPGSMFFSLPPADSASDRSWRLELMLGPGQQIWPLSFGSNSCSIFSTFTGALSVRYPQNIPARLRGTLTIAPLLSLKKYSLGTSLRLGMSSGVSGSSHSSLII